MLIYFSFIHSVKFEIDYFIIQQNTNVDSNIWMLISPVDDAPFNYMRIYEPLNRIISASKICACFFKCISNEV